MTLIAWNYPNIYRQSLELYATSTNDGSASLDGVLHSQLGFSPAMLGIRFAEISGLPDSIVRELDTEQPVKLGWEKLAEYAREGRPGVIAHLCAVGEAFARANNPQYYPHARNELDRSDNAVRQVLGPEGVQVVIERTKSIYRDVVPAVLGENLLRESPQDAGPASAPFNAFLDLTPPRLRSRIDELYQRIEPNRIDESVIRDLVYQVVPLMGFGALVVYTADPTTSTLNPVMRLGRPHFTEIKAVPILRILNDSHPIRKAYTSGLLVSESSYQRTGERRSFVAVTIGTKIRIGVLYLETECEPQEEFRTDLVHAAKLLAACLEDFLHLG